MKRVQSIDWSIRRSGAGMTMEIRLPDGEQQTLVDIAVLQTGPFGTVEGILRSGGEFVVELVGVSA